MSKLISIKLNEDIFKIAERVIREKHISRNAYINQAIRLMNRMYGRHRLRRALRKESQELRSESQEVLREFEEFQNEGL